MSVFRTGIAAEWIDYNEHLRDAYYSLIFSLATDALMDRIGLDEAYRTRTRNTLYTLEMHIHFLHEVMKTDVVEVSVRILGTDRKRIHAAFDMYCARYPDPVSTAEMMLLHVHQGKEPKSEAFPVEVIDALSKVAAEGVMNSGATTGAGAAGGSVSASGTAAAGGSATASGTPAAGGSATASGTGVAACAAGGDAGGAAGALRANADGATARNAAGGSGVAAAAIPGSRRMELRSR